MTKYKVTGPTAFMDYQPGEEFDAADLDEDLLERAVDRGSIAKATANKKAKEADDV